MIHTRRRPTTVHVAIVGALLWLTGCAPLSAATSTATVAGPADPRAAAEATANAGAAATPPGEPPAPVQSHSAAAAVKRYRSVRSHDPTAPPAAVTLPTIGVSSDLQRLGRNADGTIEVPDDWQQAGWYREGPKPGQVGPAVILGHVDSKTGPAVFHRLRELRAGDVVHVDRVDGSVATFVVQRIERHAKTRFPTDDVYLPTLRPTLRLVTCGGEFDAADGRYRDNVVVFATLAE